MTRQESNIRLSCYLAFLVLVGWRFGPVEAVMVLLFNIWVVGVLKMLAKLVREG